MKKQLMDKADGVSGAGGGGGKTPTASTPVEAPNTLQAFIRGRILDLIAYGPIKGLVNGLKSVYLDSTPVQNSDGTFNFEGVELEFRNGTPDQDVIPGFTDVENTTEINTEVLFDNPPVRALTNNDADSISITVQLAGLAKQEDNGNIVAHTVSVMVDISDNGGAWVNLFSTTINGKTTSAYPQTYRVKLPETDGPFSVRVRRGNKESDSDKIRDALTWTLLTEIIEQPFTYPNMALAGITVNSKLFGSSMPARSYDVYLSVVKVPSNYDPETRAYAGLWDGTFKEAWTDNPAWAYYDLATHPIIGAGLLNVDKWELYRIGQYCDELVPDGYGGMEPRFTINTVFSEQEDAYVALNTLASIFRGMTYWGTNTVVPVGDMPTEPSRTVGPGNVVDGEFNYVGTADRERHSVCIAMWNDPENDGKSTPEVYEDPDSIAEFGWRETRVTAVGCNSRGQAHRLAKWILYSERMETQTLTYKAKLDHATLRPGEVIEVGDPDYQGARMVGRLLEGGQTTLVLDKIDHEAMATVGGTWYVSVVMPDQRVEKAQVSSVQGNTVYLVGSLPEVPQAGAIWALSSAGLVLPQYRVVSVKEEDDSTYVITATEYDPNKYDIVEYDLKLPERPTSLIPTGPITPPTDMTFEVYKYQSGGSEHQGVIVSWKPSKDVRVETYVLDVQGPSDAAYRTVYNGEGVSFDLQDAHGGEWLFRVRAVSKGIPSQWLMRTVQLQMLLLPTPPDSIDVKVGTFDVTLTPRSAYPEALWEFWRSTVALGEGQIETNASYIATGTYLADTGLKPDTQYFYYVRGTNQYGKSTWYAVQAKTENNFDDILEAVTEEIKEGELYQWLNEEIDTKATQVAIDKATEVVDSALVDVNAQLDTLGTGLTQVNSDLQQGLTDAAAATAAVKTQADGLRTDLNTNISYVNGQLSTINSDLATLKPDMTSVKNSITAINTTTGQLRTDLTALQGTVSTEVGRIDGTLANLQSQITNAVDAQVYDKSKAYTAGQFAYVGNSLYQAKINVPAKADGTNAPPNGTYWRDAGSVVASADGLAARVTTAETNIGTINGTLTSQATTISGIQTTLNGKADASALTALTNRVTAAEGTITSQGTAITNLTNTVAGKADASALTALTTRVTTAENTISSQGTAITNLTNTVAGKADASALTALTTRVTAAEGSITSLSSSMTSVQATLGNIGGAGSNMLPAEYTAFSGTVPATSTSSTYSVAVEADSSAFNGHALKITTNSTANGAIYFVPSAGETLTYAHANMGFKRGKYLLSYYAKANVAGHTVAPFLKSFLSDGSSVNSSIVSQNQALTTSWARYSAVIDMTSAAHVGDLMLLCMQTNVSLTAGRVVWLDKVMIEPMVGENAAPSAFVLGNSYRQALNNASATTALEARVTAAEGVNTSQSTSITNLTNSLAGKADASALTALTTRVTTAENTISSQGSAITNLTNTVAGKADASALTALTTRVTAAEGVNTSQGTAITNLQNSLSGKADASALTALTTRVTTAENTLTSQGNALTTVQATLGNIGGNGTNLLPAEYCVFGATAPAMVVGGGITASVEADATAFSGYALKFQKDSGTSTVYLSPSTVFGTANMAMKKKKYLVSMFARAGTAGHQFRAGFRAIQADGTVVFHYPSNMTVTTEWARYTTVIDMTSSPADKMILCIDAKSGSGAYGVPVWVDKIMVEEQIGTSEEPSAFVIGNSASQVSGLASAQTALEARVTAAEGVNTSQATSITNLTSSLAGKADASALTALTTRVTTAEGNISSQGSALTNLTNTVAGKADASALTALTTRVTAAEGVNTSQGAAITSLTNSLSGKADVSALTALTTRVTTAENSLTSQSNALTSVQATVNNIAGSGVNLLPSTWSWINSTGAIPLPKGSALNLSMVAIAEADSGFGVKSDTVNGGATNNGYYMYSPTNNDGGRNIRIEPGTYLVSMYVKASAAATIRVSLYNGTHRYSADQISTTVRTRMVFPVTVTDSARISVTVYPNRLMADNISTEIDSVMIERRIGESNVPSAFVAGPSASEVAGLASAQTALDARVTAAEGVNTSQSTSITNLTSSLAGKADAAALTALTTRVTNAENVNTSQASSITNLTAGLGNTAQEDALLNPTWSADGVLKTENSSGYQMDYANATDAGVPAGAPASRLLWRLKKASDSGWGGVVLTSTNKIGEDYQIFSRANAGDVINLSCHMYCENAVANAGRIAITPVYEDGNSGGVGNVRVLAYEASTGGWQFLTAQYTIPAGFAGFRIYVVPEGVSPANFKMWLANLKITRQSAGEKAQAAATQSLDTRVTAAEGTLTSQGVAITNLTNSLAGKADAAALTALTTRVTTAENALTSQSSSLTSLAASVNAIAGSGTNLAPSEYSAYTDTAPGFVFGSGITGEVEADSAAFSGYAMKLNKAAGTGTVYFASGSTYAASNIQVKQKKYIVSVFVKAAVSGHEVKFGVRGIKADGTVTAFTYSGNIAVTNTWARYSAVIDMTTSPADKMCIVFDPKSGASAFNVNVWVDKVMIEEQIGTGSEPSSFVPGSGAGQLAAQGAALSSLTTRVTNAEGTLTSQGAAITSLTNSLAGKADASALTALTTRVTAAENSITSQATSITSLTAALGNISGNGGNLLPSQYSWLGSTLPQVTLSTAMTIVSAADSVAPSGYRYRIDRGDASNPWAMLSPSNNSSGWNINLSAGTYILSFYANGSTAAVANGITLRTAVWDGQSRSPTDFTLTTARTRYSHLVVIPSDTVGAITIWMPAGAVGDRFWVDSVMIERQIGNGTAPSTFVAGPTASEVTGLATAQSSLDARVTAAEGVNTTQATQITNLTSSLSGKADASALTALTTRVTNAESSLTSQGSSLTSLQNSLSGVSTENLIIDPTFSVGNNTNQVSATVLARNASGVPTGAPGPRVLNWNVATSGGNTYMGMNAVVNARSPESGLAHNMAVTEGEVYDFEVYVHSSVSRQFGIWTQFYNEAGASVNHNWVSEGGDGVRISTTVGAWTKLTGTATVPAGVIRMAMTLRFSAGNATVAYICAPACRKRTGNENAQAAATSLLDTRVTAAEGTLTSQGNSITSLTNSLSGKADASALTALTTRVTAAENTISSQSSAVTALQNTLGNIGGSGSNLNPSEYSVFGPNKPSIGAISTGLTYDVVTDSAALGGYALKFATSSTSTTIACYLHASNTVAAVGSFPISYLPGKYIVSFYAKASVAGHQIRAWLRALNSADSAVNSSMTTFTLTAGWVRYSMVVDLSNATTFSGSRMVMAFYLNQSGVSGRDIFFDRVMVEKQIANGTEPSVFDAGTSYTQVQAQASAISSLDTRVTSAEGVNTAQASSLTSLTSRMGTAESSITVTANTLANTNGTLSSMWAMKMNVNSNGLNYVAGMGLSLVTDATSGIAQAAIVFQADRFALLNTGSNNVSVPFFVESGVTYISAAMIKAATITTAHIADGNITYAKIGAAQIADTHIMNGHITNAKIQDLAVNTLKIAGRAVTIPTAVYTEGTVTCPGALNTQNWTAVQGLGVSSNGWEAMMTFSAMVSQNTAAGYWRIRRGDGAILASGQIGYANYTFNTPCVTLSISIMVAAAGYNAYYLDIAPWSNNLTYQTIYVANRSITYLEVMR